jgi:hypothetical protein
LTLDFKKNQLKQNYTKMKFTRPQLRVHIVSYALRNTSFSIQSNLHNLLSMGNRSLLLMGILLLFTTSTFATDYFVDAQFGDDAYNGRTAFYIGGNSGPWKSIAKVNSIDFAPGDRIFFRRGQTWTDGPLDPKNGGAPGGTVAISETVLGQPLQFQLVDPDNHRCIYFGAYGSGAKPRIDCGGGNGLVIRHNYIIVEDLHLDDGGNNMLSLSNPDGNFWNVLRNIDVTRCDGNAVRFEEGGGNCWLDGLYVYDYTSNGIYLEGSEFNPLRQVLVENCRVDNPSNSEKRDAISCHRDGDDFNISGEIIMRNNRITRSGEDAIDITSGTRILLDGNICEYSRSAGIFVSKDRVNTVEIRGNFINSNTNDSGVGDLTIGAANVWAVNNIIIGTGHHSVLIQQAPDIQLWHNIIAPGERSGHFIWFRDEDAQAVFKNNIFDFSGTSASISGPLDNHTFDHNCYYGDSPGREIYSGSPLAELQSSDPSFEPNGFWADPRFANPSLSDPMHFKLANNSPCVDRGADLPLERDFEGNVRPQGNGADIGVFEKAGSGDNCPPAGTACDDNDPTTEGDIEDGNCNCEGTPCPVAGTICDDDDPNTENDMEDGQCNCAGTPIVCPDPGTPCNDGNPSTTGDIEDGNCNCEGTPCPVAGTICDDGDPNTKNDMEDGQCNCAGTPIVCPDPGTPCNDGNPSTTGDIEDGDCNCAGTPCPAAGTTCDDDDPNTENDMEDGQCNCAGTPIVCPDPGTPCNDGNPSTTGDVEDGNCNCAGTPCPVAGTTCDDGDPNTENDVEDGFCNCAGIPTDSPPSAGVITVQVNRRDDDVEERTEDGRMTLHSSDLELGYDDDDQQTVGIRFNEIDIPPGAGIIRAYIQFTVEDVEYGNSYLTVTGQAVDHAPSFSSDDYDASSRVRTNASVDWAVPDWRYRGLAGLAQQTPDLSPIVREIVGRPGWRSGNSMVFLFEGTGSNSAESYNGSDEDAPKLIIEYATDCPLAGTPCDDGDDTTENDRQDGACHCTGTPTEEEPEGTMITAQIEEDDDDVEERALDGEMSLHSSDLELGYDGRRRQIVGLRFNELIIPPGATIHQAYIQFTVEDVKRSNAQLTITGQNTGDAPVFTDEDYDASSRDRTIAMVDWTVPDWPDEGASGEDQRTPNLRDIVQEIVSRPDWQAGNSMAFLIEGTGTRSADSRDGSKDYAPKLVISYTTAAESSIQRSIAASRMIAEDWGAGPADDLSRLEIFPNPVEAQLTLRTRLSTAPGSSTATLTIHRSDGKIMGAPGILPTSEAWMEHKLDVSQLIPGVYVVSINTGAEILTRRFVKVGY